MSRVCKTRIRFISHAQRVETRCNLVAPCSAIPCAFYTIYPVFYNAVKAVQWVPQAFQLSFDGASWLGRSGLPGYLPNWAQFQKTYFPIGNGSIKHIMSLFQFYNNPPPWVLQALRPQANFQCFTTSLNPFPIRHVSKNILCRFFGFYTDPQSWFYKHWGF